MNKAIHVATGIQGLTFTIGSDGIWMNTSANGQYTCINISEYAKKDQELTQGLLEWCIEMSEKYKEEAVVKEEKEQEAKDSGQFGAGA